MFIVNTEAAIYRDGRYLIIRRSEKEEHAGGGISLVGGKVEIEGNSTDILERTIIREVAEEVGLVIASRPRYIHSTSFVMDTGIHVVNVIFLCEDAEGEPYAASANEVDAVYWMTPEEVYDHPKAADYLIDSIRKAEVLRTEVVQTWEN